MMEKETGDSWFVYMVECADQSLYTGIARDVERRVQEHNDGKAAAKYTRARRPVTLVYVEPADSRSGACRREAAIKKLCREEKVRLRENQRPSAKAARQR